MAWSALLALGVFAPVHADEFAGYAGPESCKECHAVEYERWSVSAHGLAERVLSPDRDSVAFTAPLVVPNAGDETTVRRRNEAFEIIAFGESGRREAFEVVRAIGTSPVRQYLTALSRGRVQVHEASYDTVSNQWFGVYGNDRRNPGEYGHWTGRGMNWNSRCAACHNTRVKKNYDGASDSYQTTMAGMSVGCEACHGPLAKHIGWQRKQPKPAGRDPTVEPFLQEATMGMCASCHSRNADLTGDFLPGESFYDHYRLDILDPSERWYYDGQVKDEDYEFAAYLGSKMHEAGVTCIDCHTRDVTKPKLKGNDLCMKCHGGQSKAPVIHPEKHGHHKLDEPGGQCMGCHMPSTIYMQRHARHDHGFTIPDPLLTLDLSIPNACSRCHSDKSVEWAVQHTDKWYGAKMNRLSRERTRFIAMAASGSDARGLRALVVTTNLSPYWTAVAASFLSSFAQEAETRAALLGLLGHEHPLVRERAVRALEPALASPGVSPAIEARLKDSRRNVRVAVAWLLRATVDINSEAGRDLQRMLDWGLDQPAGQYQQAMLLVARQQPGKALEHLKKAVEWDPISPPFLCALAQLHAQLGNKTEALKSLARAEATAPGDPRIAQVKNKILSTSSD